MARLPGFRAGHVPASIIRQRFGEEIKSDVVESLVPRYFRQEAEKQGLIPVSQPRVTDLHIHDGEPLRFKASFEVLPEIKVEGYKELRAEKTGDHGYRRGSRGGAGQRARAARHLHCGRGPSLADGDFAQVSLDGDPKDGEGQPVHMDEILVEIAGKNTMPEFTENLRGASAGDERSFDVMYPQDCADKRLAGKDLHLHRQGAVDQAEEPAGIERCVRQGTG